MIKYEFMFRQDSPFFLEGYDDDNLVFIGFKKSNTIRHYSIVNPNRTDPIVKFKLKSWK